MMYLIGQILCCLLIAALLGFVIGWLLKGWFCKNEKETLEKELKEAQQQNKKLQDDLERQESRRIKSSPAASAPDRGILAKTNVKDDLKKIKGIGVVIEGVLNSLNITSFRQIAQFSDQDIKMVAESLDVFPGRITRDNWIAQAKELHFVKYSEKL
jgi:predicted flap endonuclease-1-like 5' DNA nuclease